jgi:heme-degrading monooxygenase HmoA
MFGRVTRLEGSPEQMAAGEDYVKGTILPAARQLDGFRGVLSLTDREGGKGLTITFWETEEAMRASEERANQLRDEAAQALSATVAGVERYEVTVNELS